jgi:O-antigen/teichoic acid export membrane protein
MSLAHRTVSSTAWSMAGNVARMGVLFLRSVLLARLLPVEVFGVYGYAASLVGIASVAADFGTGRAFIHRASETADEGQAAAVHFTLTLGLSVAWVAALVAGALLFAGGQTRQVLLVLTASRAVGHLASTPSLILSRRVAYRRLVLIEVLNALLTTLVALGLAWRGATLWALLSVDIVGAVVLVVGLYLWKPVWRPALAWSAETVRYFLGFSSQIFVGRLLAQGLARVDDLWVGYYLGKEPLGFYSRAFAFAGYPRAVFAKSIDKVTAGTYAELKGNRLSLSRAFYRTNTILVRTGFLLGGLFALIAPEFIRLLIGAKWLPMLGTFRLMLVLTLLNPVKGTVANLFVAVGKPNQVVRARLVQFGVLLVGLYCLGPRFGPSGVALAQDIMLIVGTVLLFRQAMQYVDFSAWRLFAVPSLGLGLGALLARGAILVPGVLGSDWRTGFVKALVFSGVYGAVLACLEREDIYQAYAFLKNALLGQGRLLDISGAWLRTREK